MENTGIKRQCQSALDTVSSIPELKTFPVVQEELPLFRKRLDDDEFRIAVVGEFSSGKSTFINALLGKDILKHASTETTAVVTRIVNVREDDPLCGSGTVSFRNGGVETLRDFAKLQDYTTTSSREYEVVRDIASVDIYYPILDSKRKIALVDTPGLNGVAEGHKSQTIQLIGESHACIYLLGRRGVAESDTSFLRYLTRVQKNFIFVQNFIDDFHDSEDERPEEALAKQEALLRENVFQDLPDGRHIWRICGVSALMALAGRDASIPRLYADSAPIRSREERQEIYRQSRFESLLSIMRETYRDDALDKIQYEDTASAIRDWLKEIIRLTEGQERQTLDIYNASRDRNAMRRLQRAKEAIENNRERQENYLQNFVDAETNSIRQEEQKRLTDALTDTREKFCQNVQSQKNADALRKLSGTIGQSLRSAALSVLEESQRRYVEKLNLLRGVLLRRISDYTNTGNLTLDMEELRPESVNLTVRLAPNDNVSALQARIDAKARESSQAERERADSEKRRQISEERMKDIQREQQGALRERDDKLRRMGTRPQVVQREESYSVEVSHGGLGIMDFLFGKKTVWRTRTVRDDSAAKEYDRKLTDIQNKYATKTREISRKLEEAKREQRKWSENAADARVHIQSIRAEIDTLENRLAREQTLQKKKETLAKEEYVRNYKERLCAQLDDYLIQGDGSVLNRASQAMEERIASVGRAYKEQALSLFRKSVEQNLRRIEQAIHDRSPEILREAERYKQILLALRETMDRLEAV